MASSPQNTLPSLFNWPLRFKLILLICLLVISSGLTAIFLVYQELGAQLVTNKEEQLASDTEIQATHIQSHIRELVRDVQFLSNTPPVQAWAKQQDPGTAAIQGRHNWHSLLSQIFSEMLAAKPQYTQIRLIGTTDNGREIIRADRYTPNGAVRLVAEDQLQQKGSRPYFLETVQLSAGQVYLSKIELNREFGKVSVPHEPVLRSAVPILDSSGRTLRHRDYQ